MVRNQRSASRGHGCFPTSRTIGGQGEFSTTDPSTFVAVGEQDESPDPLSGKGDSQRRAMRAWTWSFTRGASRDLSFRRTLPGLAALAGAMWGMNLEPLVPAAGRLVELGRATALDVPPHWHLARPVPATAERLTRVMGGGRAARAAVSMPVLSRGRGSPCLVRWSNERHETPLGRSAGRRAVTGRRRATGRVLRPARDAHPPVWTLSLSRAGPRPRRA
jgi:hypothetical protein